jgi:hypothetical protein
MITLENWRERMRADMALRDYRPRTQSSYELATGLFLDWAKAGPLELTDGHVRRYFLFLRVRTRRGPSCVSCRGRR